MGSFTWSVYAWLFFLLSPLLILMISRMNLFVCKQIKCLLFSHQFRCSFGRFFSLSQQTIFHPFSVPSKMFELINAFKCQETKKFERSKYPQLCTFLNKITVWNPFSSFASEKEHAKICMLAERCWRHFLFYFYENKINV